MPISTIGANSLQQAQILTKVQQPAGCILQVQQTVLSTAFSGTVVGSYQPVTGLSVTVTPFSVNSRFLVTAQISTTDSNNYPPLFHIYRNGTQCTPNGLATGFTPSTAYAYLGGGSLGGAGVNVTIGFQYLDSPSTASAVTYQIYAAKPSIAGSYVQINNIVGGSSVITVMEIAG